MKKAGVDSGRRAGVPTKIADKGKELERQANEIESDSVHRNSDVTLLADYERGLSYQHRVGIDPATGNYAVFLLHVAMSHDAGKTMIAMRTASDLASVTPSVAWASNIMRLACHR